MARPTDTSSSDASRGELDPMSAIDSLRADMRAMATEMAWLRERNAVLEKKVALLTTTLNDAIHERARRDYILSLLLHDQPVAQPPTEAVWPGDEALSAGRAVATGEIVLPPPFVLAIRQDSRLSSSLVWLVRERIVPNVNGRGHKPARWCHVKQVMAEQRIIVADATPTEFSKAMYFVDKSLDKENVRKACDTYHLPKGCSRWWPDGNRHKECCHTVEQWLKPLLDQMPASLYD